MKTTKLLRIRVLMCAATLMFTSVAQAHHSSKPHFDDSKEITVTGKFTQFKFVNPHAYLYFEVEQNGATVPWRCELQAATQLKHSGWTRDMFSEGQVFTVTGSPARREDNVCYLKSLKLADGKEILRQGNLNDDAPAQSGIASAPTSKPIDRPVKLADGQLNLKGPWVSLSFGRRNTLGIRPRYKSTEAGNAAVGNYEMAYDDPILSCHYVNLINGWNHDKNVNDIYQTKDTVTMQYGFMDVVRTIHLNMDKHPENIAPSSTGHSIGRWDGDTLVVDTIGLEEGVLSHSSGMKHSDQMHVIERFSVNQDEMQLYRDYTIVDPLYLEGETTGQDIMAYTTTEYTPYDCVELSGKNNLRPDDERYDQIDATGEIASAAAQPVAAQPLPASTQAEEIVVKTDDDKQGGSVGLMPLLLLGVLGLVRRRYVV